MSDTVLRPDLDTIRDHLTLIGLAARAADPEASLELAYVQPHESAAWKAQHFGTDAEQLDRAARFAFRVNAEGFNVYPAPNPRKAGHPFAKRCGDQWVDVATFHWVDLDAADAERRLKDWMADPHNPLPTWVTVTGTTPHMRLQLFWQLDVPARNLEAWRAQQRALAQHFGGDPVVDPSRVMRLAGSVNHPTEKKRARGYATELTRRAKGAWGGIAEAEEMAAAVPPVWEAHAPARPERDPSRPHPNLPTHEGLSVEELVAELRHGNVNNTLLALVGHWVRRGWSDYEILAWAPRLTLPPTQVSEIEATLADMIARTRRKFDEPERKVAVDEVVAWDAPPDEKPGLPLVWHWEAQPSLEASDIVEDTLCDGQMSVVYGESNCGKTFFATDLALHLATGEPWRGRAVERGGVIYVAAEGGWGIRNRIAAHRLSRGLEDARVPFGIVPAAINLLDPEADTPRLIELIQAAARTIELPIRLVVVDTLSRAMAGGNENSPEDMTALVRNGDLIRQATGAHLMWIHHSGKDTARGARGHSSLRAATDTEIEVTRDEGALHSVAKVTKQREMPVDGAFAFSLEVVELGHNKRGKPVTSCVVHPIDPDTLEDAAPRRRVKLGDMPKLALQELRNVAAEEGKTTTLQLDGATRRAVALEDWRHRLVITGAISSETRQAKARDWGRVQKALRAAGLIGIFGDYVWLV